MTEKRNFFKFKDGKPVGVVIYPYEEIITEKQYRLNKWGTRLLKNNRPLFDWFNDSDEIVDLLNELHEENVILKKIIDEDDVLMKSLLSAYYNKKWEDFCKNYGVDFDERETS